MILTLFLAFAAITSCSDKGSFKIDVLQFDDIIKPNTPSNVKATGTFSKKILSGTLKTVVKYGIIKVVDQTEDFCGFISCPAEGYSDASRDFTIPSIAPGGK
eukprot:NODE_834_length_3613_cov_0.384178.p5 type:complete len:102 gc:universal NODE_834_length_3613_cov_0.384178:2533-2838(+)